MLLFSQTFSSKPYISIAELYRRHIFLHLSYQVQKMSSFKYKVPTILGLLMIGFFFVIQQAAGYTIGGFGRLEAMYSGFFQVFLPIGIILAVAFLVYKVFLPGASKFIGGLFG